MQQIQKYTTKKAFTLIEILLSITVLGFFVIVLFQTLSYISNTAIRIENQKQLGNEVLYVTQVVQNYADSYTINYNKYENKDINLKDKNGIVDKLYLSGNNGSVSIYGTGTCGSKQTKCWLELASGSNKIKLTNPDLVHLDKNSLYFKIIPYQLLEDIQNFEEMYAPGFWIGGKVYIDNYKENDSRFNIKESLYMFYGLSEK